MKSLDVIVPTFHSESLIETFVKSFEYFKPKELDIRYIVVENSTDTSYMDKIKNLAVDRVVWINNDTTEIKSRANATGIHTGLEHAKSEYVFLAHCDTCVTSTMFFKKMIQKIEEGCLMVGTQKRSSWYPNALHISGIMVKTSIANSVNYFPVNGKEERLDVGDILTKKCEEENIKYFCFDNTFCENDFFKRDVLKRINKRCFKNFFADRCVDEEGNVIFMHLGRGISKSPGSFDGVYSNANGKYEKALLEDWYIFFNTNVIGQFNRNNFEKTSGAALFRSIYTQNLDFQKEVLYNQSQLRKSAIPYYEKGGILVCESHAIISTIIFLNKIHNNSQPFRILEIGTGPGWSTLCFAYAAKLLQHNKIDIKIDTIDVNKEFQDRVLNLLKAYNLESFVNFHENGSDDFFKSNKNKYNFVLIDGDHSYDQFSKDIKNSFDHTDKKNPYAIFCDDAYRTPEEMKGVDDAIIDFLSNQGNLLKHSFFVDESLFDLHRYPEDVINSQRISVKWKERDYKYWHKEASTKTSMFGIINLEPGFENVNY